MSAHVTSATRLAPVTATSSLATPIRVGLTMLAVGLTAAAAQFTTPVPFTAVPFTLTPLVVLLAGAALGSRLGAAAQVGYLAAGMMGLAVFSPSATLPPGALRLLGPTGGYLLAYPLAAFLTGWLAERGWDRRYVTSFAAMSLGLAVIFAGGVTWLTLGFTHSWSTSISTGLLPFVVADLLKVAAAAMILPQIWRVIGRN